jgi:hypothetical protein
MDKQHIATICAPRKVFGAPGNRRGYADQTWAVGNQFAQFREHSAKYCVWKMGVCDGSLTRL